VYATVDANNGIKNQVQAWTLDAGAGTAAFDTVIFNGIPARQYHNGGRLRLGPDERLYVGTGDAGDPNRSQDTADPAGKILRIELDGSIPEDNPFSGSATWVYGLRNTQGFDWREDGRLLITDHGPSGLPAENGRRDHDEVSLAGPGDNLGWPVIYACEETEGMITPSITFGDAMPPGGAALYTGTEISEWTGDLLIGVLGFGEATRHLHRLRLAPNGDVELSEVYLSREYGRLREVIMGPDGGLYVTTSNCDGRGDCGDGDLILRLGR
jgi:glucose/arabinose dehydrogenase